MIFAWKLVKTIYLSYRKTPPKMIINCIDNYESLSLFRPSMIIELLKSWIGQIEILF